jgi:hypothetical protein
VRQRFDLELMGLIGPIIEIRWQVGQTGLVGAWQFVLCGRSEGAW